MKNRIILGLVILIGLGLFFVNFSYALGWLLGWAVMLLVAWLRQNVLVKIIDFDHFKARHYVLYLLAIMLLIALPLGVAFFFPEIVNPYAIFLAYFIDRILMFATGSLKKEVR
ncbi:hypothetical protein [Eremococcus coleocola]|uniref:Uncharacterized protein n=1 Tax=Eremococcus coleocola ACS-139-V-Col8 TaxID=908337 RepID=E4KQS4_9LACT|nr:hypothetical protein [Eremococcus coleocola]EFR30689.1 hypothetical protein HMPREF9257_0634 [Eremococcus coleocola ACS-139-V-Col8]